MAELIEYTPNYDYSSIGGFGGEAAQSVNGEMINKIRAAEEKAKVEPLIEDINNITLEKEKLDEIKTQVTALEDIVSYFDLYNEENVFNQYLFDVTGSSVVFEQRDGATLENGMTSVQVEQLAQKDVYQSIARSDSTLRVDGITNSESATPTTMNEQDTITIGVAGKPVYQSNATFNDSSTNLLSDGVTTITSGTFTINGGDVAINIDTSVHTTWDAIKDAINNYAGSNSSVVASYENNRLTLAHKDGETALSFTDGDNVLAGLGIDETEYGKKFAAVQVERTTTITNNGTGTSDLVGEGTFSITTEGKSTISFDTDATTTWEELQGMINSHPSYSASFNGNNLEIQASDQSLSINISHNLNATLGTISDNSNLASKTYEELASEINKDENLQATMEMVGDNSYKMILKSTGTGDENKLQITTHSSDLVTGMDWLTNFGITDDSAGTDANHIQVAQNLKAKVDGIDFEISTNTIELSNGLNITALKEDDIIDGEKSTLSISNDTSAISVAAEAMATTYNNLVETINTELNSPESVIGDRDKLRTLLADIKSILFQSYGATEPEFGSNTDEYGDVILAHSNVTNNDKNIFIFGFELDKTGNLSVDTNLIQEIANGNHDTYSFNDLKSTFTGVYENKGLGAQFSDYLDTLDGYQGLFTNYESSMNDRKIDLEKDKEDELEKLDSKYGIMAEQFAQYSALIAQIESNFTGLKMMIEQSTSSN